MAMNIWKHGVTNSIITRRFNNQDLMRSIKKMGENHEHQWSLYIYASRSIVTLLNRYVTYLIQLIFHCLIFHQPYSVDIPFTLLNQYFIDLINVHVNIIFVS